VVGVRHRADRSLLDRIAAPPGGSARAAARDRGRLRGDRPHPAGRRLRWDRGHDPIVQWLFEAVAVVALPLLYVSFAAPRWLRRLWRQREEDEYHDAVHDLVLFSPDRPTLAKRASEWGLRLVGAEGIAIVDANGEVLALRGLSADAAHGLAAQIDPKGQPRLLATTGSSREDAIVVPLPLDLGMGAMVVVSGPYTPFFGSDEVSRLRGYAANITAALDRARVTERLASLEKAKTQFLNLASHELRSPLGVINGYLSMLEQGSLGQLKEPGLRALEVLKAKTVELNPLVAQMLDAARLEDGRLALKRNQMDLRVVAAAAMQVVQPLAGPDHALTLETPPAPVTAMGDPDRIQTIISNLLENAIKYSPNGGRIQCIVSMADRVAAPHLHVVGADTDADSESRLAYGAARNWRSVSRI
jgi:signal transduction histidine kinase